MKKWIWVLALPYVVTVSTGELELDGNEWTHATKYNLPLRLSNDFVFNYSCSEGQKDVCYDMAEALNAAHERRIDQLHGKRNTLTITCEHFGTCGEKSK